MNKIQRSARLIKVTFTLLLRERRLLLFPLVASGLTLVAALFFLAPIAFYPTGHSIFTAAHWTALAGQVENRLGFPPDHSQHAQSITGSSIAARIMVGHPAVAGFLVLAYFLSMFLATFSNVAFCHEIIQALNGNAVSLKRGYRVAAARWQAVLLWSLFAGLVGYLIRTLEDRVGFLGRIIMGFIGLAWSVSCTFILPALACDTETKNPLTLLRHSAGTLKRTWGELVVGFVGLELAFGIIFGLVFILFLVVPGFVWVFHSSGRPVGHLLWIQAAGLGAVFLVGLLLSWTGKMVNSVYRCALFIYATEDVIPGEFDKALLDSAWRVK